VPVRYSDIDAQGVVFNMWYLGWFDEAMMAYLEHRGAGVDRLLQAGLETQLVHTDIDWQAPLRWRDPVSIEVVTSALGRTSMTLAFTVRRGEQVTATARTVYVLVGPPGAAGEGRHPAVLPEWLRAALAGLP
jgi:acyl-CoA thioester hydrolase